ncbi:MAG: hypothetical protein IJ092_14355 [Atopobiaceae bacterium]|nr:hypothetical protein [Atopobiaceae bacterium]MBR1829234.1 hypothetical protein [Atopobiaceae bacterium]
MSTFKKIRNRIILYSVLTSLGFAVYYLLLTEEARHSLKDAKATVTDSYQKMSNVIQDATGIVMEDSDEFLPNRDATVEQWKNIGF